MVPKEVVEDWASKEKYIQERINRINKRLKKYNKQKIHFEFRLKLIQKLKKNKDEVVKDTPSGS